MIFVQLITRITFILVVVLFTTKNIEIAKIKPHNCDEIFSFYHSKGGEYKEFIDQTKTGFNRMPPFYFLIIKLLFTEGNFIYNTRLLSLFFSLITILFLYKISRLWLDPEFSLCISVCSLVGSSSFIEVSTEARPYSLCLLILTIFIYNILSYEIRVRNKSINKYILFFLCAMLPFCHYFYGVTALFLGLAHVFITIGKKADIFKIYLCSGIFFVLFHLMLFLEQQKFGNLLAMIAFPTFERLTVYLAGFIYLDFLLIVVFFLTCVYYREHRTSFTIQISTISLLQISCALTIVFIIGVLMARMFPNSLWFLPRYYIGTVLIVPFIVIFIFSLINDKLFNYRKYFFLICALVCIYSVLDSYNHRKYFFENRQLHSYQSIPPDEIVNSQLPLYTKDIILFTHYIYSGKPIYYINSDCNLLHKIGLFFPSYQNYFVQEIKNTPCILLNIGKDIPELDDSLIFTEMEVNVGPIHKAFHLRDYKSLGISK